MVTNKDTYELIEDIIKRMMTENIKTDNENLHKEANRLKETICSRLRFQTEEPATDRED